MKNNKYWSCSKFADWLRGTDKPWAETAEGWNEWEVHAKKDHPTRFWMVETALDKIQDFVYWPANSLHSIKYYINNRWISRAHSLTAHKNNIKPGTWMSLGDRFLPCLFNELVDFVEIEQAWRQITFNSCENRKKYKAPFYSNGWFRWRVWRCPQAGLDYLEWAANLKNDESGGYSVDDSEWGKPTSQAESAIEIRSLYFWWKNIYINRKLPTELSGWSEFCEQHADDAKLSSFDAESKRILELDTQIGKDQENEDEMMMIRLIKIRASLWT